MSGPDTIVLTVPLEGRFRGVASLVLGGVGSRLELPYERMDDLQLAVLSLLEAGRGDEISIEVERGEQEVSVAVGPLEDGTHGDAALSRVLERLVDGVERAERQDGEWVTLRVVLAESASPSRQTA